MKAAAVLSPSRGEGAVLGLNSQSLELMIPVSERTHETAKPGPAFTLQSEERYTYAAAKSPQTLLAFILFAY